MLLLQIQNPREFKHSGKKVHNQFKSSINADFYFLFLFIVIGFDIHNNNQAISTIKKNENKKIGID